MDNDLPRLLAALEENRRMEREVLTRFLADSLTEQRRGQRGKNLFRLFLALYLLLLVVLARPDWPLSDLAREATDRHVALVKIHGAISASSRANAEDVLEAVTDALDDDRTAGLILSINSPGGSPVQSGRIFQEIRRLAATHPDIPVHAVLEDLCASGGYYVAVAASRIHAHRSSLVGSIGVIFQGFGVEGAMEKLGVESRLLTAGEHKALLNPFAPVKEEEKEHMRRLLRGIHDHFIAAVRQGRGDRLKGREEELFSGLIWTGEEAVALGLVDGLGSVETVAREVMGVEKVKDFTHKESLLTRLSGKVGMDWLQEWSGVELR